MRITLPKTVAQTILVVGVLSLSSHVLFAQQKDPQRWAILIGVDDYAQAQDLKYCGADQRALRDHFIAAGFPKDQVFLLHDKAKEKKYLPFKSNIEKQLGLVLGLVERDDVVVVAFSGHGVHLDGTSYLCPTNAELDDPETMVSLDVVYERLKTCPASLKLLMVDACRNDPRLGGQRSFKPTEGTRQFARALTRPPQGLLLLNSCTAGEISWEEKDFGHGVYMHFVLEGLRGKADSDSNGQISLGELSKYAGRKTKVYVARKFNDSQRPFLRGDLTVEALDFDISRVMARIDTPSLEGGKSITNSIGMKLVHIPAGEFMMGSSESVKLLKDEIGPGGAGFGGHEAEHPRHKVHIARPFYMGIHEVTVGQFRRFAEETGYKTDAETKKEEAEGANSIRTWRTVDGSDSSEKHPVRIVSWNDAMEFCHWQSRKEGGLYRLPTEAEWEYACRAGTKTRYWTGNKPESLAGTANLEKTEESSGRKIDGYDWQRDPIQVGQFRPNPFGLYDMHGNVEEWCFDGFHEEFYASSPRTNPMGPENAEKKCYRGTG